MDRGTGFLERAARGPRTTARKSSAIYVVHYPDGRADRVCSFTARQPWAIAAIQNTGGVWSCAGIYDTLPAKMNSYTRATAERVG